MLPVAVIDTCVLYPAALRDVLLRCAGAGLYAPRWSSQILDELLTAIAGNRPDIPHQRLVRLVSLMNAAFPEAMCETRRSRPPCLPDPGDEHVLDTAIASSAGYLLTLNIKHFPEHLVGQFSEVQVVTPDAFLLMQLSQRPEAVCEIIAGCAKALRRPRITQSQMIDSLRTHVPGFAMALALHRGTTAFRVQELSVVQARPERAERIGRAIAKMRKVADHMPKGTDGTAIIRHYRDLPEPWLPRA